MSNDRLPRDERRRQLANDVADKILAPFEVSDAQRRDARLDILLALVDEFTRGEIWGEGKALLRSVENESRMIEISFR